MRPKDFAKATFGAIPLHGAADRRSRSHDAHPGPGVAIKFC